MRIDPLSTRAQLVGTLDQKVIDCLGLCYSPCCIYIGASNIRHIESSHPKIYAAYLQEIPSIICTPDYIGVHPRQGGVEYVKLYETLGLMVVVRLSTTGRLYVRSLYDVTEEKIRTYLDRGTLKLYPKDDS